MRTIKFRGKRIDGKGFAFGSLILPNSENENTYIQGWNGAKFKVIKESVGQFSGLHDKNGKEIYEGDIFKSILNSLGNELINPKLVYEELRWVLKDSSKNRNFEYLDYYEADTELEVVGNIYENPELLTD